MPQKIQFCTFADSRLQPTLKRICKEAVDSGYFDVVYGFNEFTINSKFSKKYRSVLKYNIKGFGFWIWKVGVIIQVLDSLNDNDILVYADAGYVINPFAKQKLEQFIGLVKDSILGILAVELESDKVESKYSKGDVLEYFEVVDNKFVNSTPQIQASLIIIRKCKNSTDFFRKIERIYSDNFHLVSDRESFFPNFPNFVEHKHDQSIFSIMFKLNNGVKIPLNDVWLNSKINESYVLDSPILVIRKKNRKIFGLIYLVMNFIKYKIIKYVLD